MDHKIRKNRRTLKKRIRRITYLCILITMLLFTVIVVYIGAAFFKNNTMMISGYFSNFVAESMSTEQFSSDMGLKDINGLKPGNEKFTAWLAGIKSKSNSPAANAHPSVESELGALDFIKFRIYIDDSLIYSDPPDSGNSVFSYMSRLTEEPFASSFMKGMLTAFNSGQTTEEKVEYGDTIVRVTAKINDGYILLIGLLFSAGVLFAVILAMVAGLIISHIFTLPVSAPLSRLDEKIKAIASGSSDDAMASRIELKKPLREIESLVDSTNTIMHKMHDVNELLTAQNEELEAQNEELFNSKKQIEEAQTMLVQSENMASIGQLTAAITHEINTPLGAIHSNAQMLDVLLDDLLQSEIVSKDRILSDIAERIKESNDITIMASNRVAEIIKSLKNFSKIDQAEFQEANLNEGIRSVLVLTSNLWKRKITIHEEYGELPPVKCYPGMLNQVFMNLVVNAIQAIEKSGDIFIRTWKDEKSVYVSIRDTGCGIEEDNLRKIFESGYTTKGSSLGMGLGLSISRNIVNKHKGDITVSSKPGEGTEFTVSIPLAVQTGEE